ncbi:MAG: ATP-dependent helicase [Desulforhopalus sp.]
MNLTEEQLRIVNHNTGHARVSAVAGSGKTTTMVARIGHLLQEGVEADKILVMMFNRSARDGFTESMENRLLPLGFPLPQVRTFHSLGLRLVNSFTKRGSLPSYRLVTEEYVQEKLARQVATEVYRQEMDKEGWVSGDEVEEFLTFIDLVKSTVKTPADVFSESDLTSRYSYFVNAYELFEEVRQKQRIRFYADLIGEPLMAMLADDDLRGWVSNRVDHIIVDEYQDINESQQQLLRILAGNRAEVMVVGDVDQCIYEWRGAKPEYIIRRFQLDFPDPVNYQLSYTFRYGHQLSLAANHLIAGNTRRDSKLCISYKSTPLTQLFWLEEKHGSHPVLQVLDKWRNQGRILGEAAVLVRLFAQSVPVELALLEAGIPYRLEGNVHVFDCPEVLALTGYLHLVHGSLVELDQDTVKKFLIAMFSQPHLGIRREEMASLVTAIAEDPERAPEQLMQWCTKDIPPFIAKRFEEAAKIWSWLAARSASGPAETLLRNLVDRLELYDFYHNFATKSATAENRVKTCEAFIDFAAAQKLSVNGLLCKIDDLRQGGGEESPEALLITSVHRAKGLEWPLVVLPGLAEGSFPFFRESGGSSEDLEDERRLFYVAMTRAVEELVCIHPIDAELKRKIERKSSKAWGDKMRASRFLYEMNGGLSKSLGKVLSSRNGKDQTVVTDDARIATRYLQAVGRSVDIVQQSAETKQTNNCPPKMLKIEEIAEGMQVFHQYFGAGIVSQVRDRRQGRLTVAFKDHGEVILLARYAKLQPA